MAKRKRLTPAQTNYLGDGRPTPPSSSMVRSPVPQAPIAQVAGDVSVHAALEKVSGELQAMRENGRLIEDIPLEKIDLNYLVRDRMEQDEEELSTLMNSLRARGQQTPIEVVRLDHSADGKTYGLISGLRRITALTRLYLEQNDPKFAIARAVIITPETAEDAYQAMVEENEIRVNLSHYERARIALRAMEVGIFESRRGALQRLYANTTRSKRSKIGSFMVVVEALDDVLQYPTAISERLGLALAQNLSQHDAFKEKLRTKLLAEPAEKPDDEARVLFEVISEKADVPSSARDSAANKKTRSPGSQKAEERSRERHLARAAQNATVSEGFDVRLHADRGLIEIEGREVNSNLFDALQAWLTRHRQMVKPPSSRSE